MGIVDYTSQGSIGTTLLPKRFDIKIYQGDTFEVVLNFKDKAGNAIDLAGMTGLVQFKTLTNPPSVVATPVSTVNYNGIVGAVRLVILDTSDIPGGEYQWDFQLTDSLGKRRTFIGGKVEVTEDISE